jgi:hypothetical protein
MNYGYHPLFRARDANPLGLETYATLPPWTKAAAVLNNERFQILNSRLSFIAYQQRHEFRVESEATFENVDSCFRAGNGIPKNEHFIMLARRGGGIPVISNSRTTDYDL